MFSAPSALPQGDSNTPWVGQLERINVLPHRHYELVGRLQLREQMRERELLQQWQERKRGLHLLRYDAAQPQPPSQPPKPFQKAVVQVAAFFSFVPPGQSKLGSGALITLEGHLLTNSHVVRSGPGYCVKPPVEGAVASLIVLLVTEDLQKPPIPRYVADFVTDDAQLDIAVLKISQELKEGLNTLQDLEEKVAAAGSRDTFLAQWVREGPVRSIPIQPLTLWDSDAALVGQRIIALGYPRPDDKLRNPPLNTDDRGNIQTKPEGFLRVGAAFAAPGSSGGAVVRDEEGREYLIGLICAGEFGTGAGTALARPINAAVDGPIKAAKLAINQAPAAHFIPKPSLPRPRETVVFDALERSRDRDGRIQECQWHIKEDSQSLTLPGCRIERSFPPDSQPTVTLTVRDDKGLLDAFTQVISLRQEEGPCRAKLRGSDGQLRAEFDSIQEAINQAGPREVVEVVPPTPPRACAESLEIKGKRELTLRGAHSIEDAPAFVLAGDGENPTVRIANSESITLQGLTITQGNPGVRVESSRAIRVKQSILRVNRAHGILWVSSSGRVNDSRLEGNLADLQGLFGQGLTAEQKSVVDIIDTEIAGNAAVGVGVTGKSELQLEFVQIHENKDGLVIDGAKQVTVQNVRVRENNKAGISAKNATLTIASSLIENHDVGLEVTDATVEINENVVIAKSHNGVQIRGNAQLTLKNSTISDNKRYGLLVKDSTQATLSNAKVTDNTGALYVTGTAKVYLTSSTVSKSRYGTRGWGLKLTGNARLTLKDSTINHESLILQDNSEVIVENSTISDNESVGLQLSNSARAILKKSTISRNCMADAVEIFHGPQYSGCAGILLFHSAQATLEGNIIQDNGGCGILSLSTQPVLGLSNQMLGNGNDLCGNLSAELRMPLRKETESEILWPAEGFVSFQEAIDALRPGGTLLLEPASVQTGGVTIAKPLTLRTALGSAEVEPAVIQGRNDKAPVLSLVTGAEVRIIDLKITKGLDGIILGGNASITLEHSIISQNEAPLGSRGGLVLTGSTQATLTDSTVSHNSNDGVVLFDNAQVVIRSSTIEGNGTRAENGLNACPRTGIRSFSICNGIELHGNSRLTLIDSKIANNTDWGLAVLMNQCGYKEEYAGQTFTGRVIFEGTNTIAGNNKSGNQDGMGNPGDHPWNRPDMPDGQVCLP